MQNRDALTTPRTRGHYRTSHFGLVELKGALIMRGRLMLTVAEHPLLIWFRAVLRNSGCELSFPYRILSLVTVDILCIDKHTRK